MNGKVCQACGDRSAAEPVEICAVCHETVERAHYAKAVADIRRWLVLECKAARAERKKARFVELSRVINVLDEGVHIKVGGVSKDG